MRVALRPRSCRQFPSPKSAPHGPRDDDTSDDDRQPWARAWLIAGAIALLLAVVAAAIASLHWMSQANPSTPYTARPEQSPPDAGAVPNGPVQPKDLSAATEAAQEQADRHASGDFEERRSGDGSNQANHYRYVLDDDLTPEARHYVETVIAKFRTVNPDIPTTAANEPGRASSATTLSGVVANMVCFETRWVCLPTRPPSWHRLGPRDMSFVAKRSRHVAVAVPIVAIGGVVAMGSCQQCAQPQQPDVAHHQTVIG